MTKSNATEKREDSEKKVLFTDLEISRSAGMLRRTLRRCGRRVESSQQGQ